MSRVSFYDLHSILKDDLEEFFLPSRSRYNNYQGHKFYIKTEIRLSIAIRYFAGASVYDLMVTHGVSAKSVFLSVWGVVDCVNKNENLKMSFPTYDEQEKYQKDSNL